MIGEKTYLMERMRELAAEQGYDVEIYEHKDKGLWPRFHGNKHPKHTSEFVRKIRAKAKMEYMKMFMTSRFGKNNDIM